MSDHKERMKDLGRDYSYPDSHFDFERGRHPLQTLSRHGRRKLQKETQAQWKQLRPLLIGMKDDGAGFPIDQTIRAFASEYNNRSLSHGTQVMPSSFNVMEAFLAPQKFEECIPIFLLRDERDHLFSLSDFSDYLTSSDCQRHTAEKRCDCPRTWYIRTLRRKPAPTDLPLWRWHTFCYRAASHSFAMARK